MGIFVAFVAVVSVTVKQNSFRCFLVDRVRFIEMIFLMVFGQFSTLANTVLVCLGAFSRVSVTLDLFSLAVGSSHHKPQCPPNFIA